MSALSVSPSPPDPDLRPDPLVMADIMSRQVLQVDERTCLADAARLMAEGRRSSLLVTRHGDAVGILTERDMLRLFTEGTDGDTPVEQVMSAPLATAQSHESFTDVWGRMLAQRLRHLVVVDGEGHALGLVTETDFRNHMDSRLLTQLGGLSDLVERDLNLLSPQARLDEALHIMLAQRSTYVLVAQDRQPLGILTERDIPRLMASAARPGERLANLAHQALHTITEEVWIVEAAAQMQRLHVRHLVVVDAQGLLVGMVQMHRIMTRLGEHLQHRQAQLQNQDLRARSASAEQRLTLAADAANMGFWEIDLATGDMLLSSHSLRLLGDPALPQEPRLDDFLDVVHPDDRAGLMAALDAAREPGGSGSVNLEYRVHRPMGQVRWLHAIGQVIGADASGRPTRALGVSTDITQLKTQQAQLADTLALLQQRQAELEHLSRTIERSPVVAITWRNTPGWPVQYVSNNVRLWGYTADGLKEGSRSFESLIHPDDLPRINQEIDGFFSHRQDTFDQTYRLRSANGNWIWIEDHTWVERSPTGEIDRVHGVLTDISDRVWMERTADLERQLLAHMAQGEELPQVLNDLVLDYEQLMPGVACSVLLLTESQDRVTEGAAPSLPRAFRQAVEGQRIGPAAGSCGTAMFTHHNVIVGDIANDPLWADYREVALANGLAACWSVPILGSQGRVLGSFALYTASPRWPTSQQLQAIERGAALAGMAIERDQNQNTLRKLSLAVEQSPNSIVITNLKAEIEYVNQAFIRITGYSKEEVLGKNPRILHSGKTPTGTYTHMWEALLRGEAWRGEFTNLRKDGAEYVESVLISPVAQADGQVTHYLAIKEDITRQKQAEQQIYRLAYFDVLTGLPNRQLLADRFQQAASMAKRQGTPLALMFIDLDHFKNINDTLGHSAGDDLLVQVARRLESLVRAGDTLSRQGGDEFVLVLPGCGLQAAKGVAQKLIEQGTRSFSLGSQEVVVTLSVGIALYPDDGTDLETLAKNADVAMYQAKQAGRSTFRLFTPDMQVRSGRTLALENSLRHAVDRQELQLVYQPQVSLSSGKLVGLEALVRWHHPDMGLVSPAEFIPLAEATGQILRIGEWVLTTAARQLQNWILQEQLPPLVMAVNLSAVQFRDPDLAHTVARVLKDTGLPPSCLELELTESTAMDDPQGSMAGMARISALGVAVSIDDFGTGYSSLSYLKRFKVSKLKIDQSFVRDITNDPDDKAIVSTIIGLARNLELRTIAEGVETPGQLAWLRSQGCDEAQGYFFSQPLMATEFLVWASAYAERVSQQPPLLD